MRTQQQPCWNLALTFSAVYGRQHARKHGRAETGHAVRDRWPPIKILLVSGKVRLHPLRAPVEHLLVVKPYRAAAMVEQLPSIVGSA